MDGYRIESDRAVGGDDDLEVVPQGELLQLQHEELLHPGVQRPEHDVVRREQKPPRDRGGIRLVHRPDHPRRRRLAAQHDPGRRRRPNRKPDSTSSARRNTDEVLTFILEKKIPFPYSLLIFSAHGNKLSLVLVYSFSPCIYNCTATARDPVLNTSLPSIATIAVIYRLIAYAQVDML